MIIKPFSNNFTVNSHLTGQPFLRNGQCCTGQAGTNTSFEDVTTFREDYCNPSNPSGRRKQFEPPQPASVIHKNNCFLKLEGELWMLGSVDHGYVRVCVGEVEHVGSLCVCE